MKLAFKVKVVNAPPYVLDRVIALTVYKEDVVALLSV
jgi:hypothetical protein